MELREKQALCIPRHFVYASKSRKPKCREVHMNRSLVALATGAVLLGLSHGALACGTVTIANMNWASAELMANVDKIILEKGYG